MKKRPPHEELSVVSCVCLTEQGEGIAGGAKLLGVVHTIDHGAAALPGVQEVVCTAWVDKKRTQIQGKTQRLMLQSRGGERLLITHTHAHTFCV